LVWGDKSELEEEARKKKRKKRGKELERRNLPESVLVSVEKTIERERERQTDRQVFWDNRHGELEVVDEAHDHGSGVYGCAHKGAGAIGNSWPFSLLPAPSYAENISDHVINVDYTTI